MIYCFDLDGTLCTNTNGDYKNAEPFLKRIKIVNELHENGNKIIIDTARGATTGIDWLELTTKQLNDWGVKYHKLYVGRKLHYDIIVDDKAINDLNFFSNEK
jgi:hydroxymethylpyrimidine pyrophosphatase-like HAD family hydrolase